MTQSSHMITPEATDAEAVVVAPRQPQTPGALPPVRAGDRGPGLGGADVLPS